jgi:hypothetical protein
MKDVEGGGSYQIFEFVGLYVRYFISKLLRMDISLTELSGEKDYPHIDTRQRIMCLVVGILTVVALFVGVVFIIYKMEQ